MAKKDICDSVNNMAKPIIEKLGYELVEVKYSKMENGNNLTLFIYSKSGISLDDCEKVSNALDEPLDNLNPTNNEPYCLNVSSLGIDRPIKTPDDARRNIGNKVDVKLYAADENGKKMYTGIIVEYTNDNFTIDCNGKKLSFRYDKIALCSPVIEF